MWYAGMEGDNSQSDKRASGAYVFRPNGTTPHQLAIPKNVMYEGRFLQQGLLTSYIMPFSFAVRFDAKF